LNPRSCIYYALSLRAELSSQRQIVEPGCARNTGKEEISE